MSGGEQRELQFWRALLPLLKQACMYQLDCNDLQAERKMHLRSRSKSFSGFAHKLQIEQKLQIEAGAPIPLTTCNMCHPRSFLFVRLRRFNLSGSHFLLSM